MILLADTFSPLAPPQLPEEAPTRAGDLGVASLARRPVLTGLTWESLSATGTPAGRVTISVGAPSLVSVLRVEPALNPAERCQLELAWRPAGDPHSKHVNGQLGGEAKHLRFRGPFAFLPRAGVYELIAQHRRSGAGALPFYVVAQVEQGVTPEEVDALLCSRGAAYVYGCSTNIPGVGVYTSPCPDVHSTFMRYRRFRLQNTHASAGLKLRVGRSSGGCEFTVAAGATFDLPPELCGRQSLTATSTGAQTTVTCLVSLW